VARSTTSPAVTNALTGQKALKSESAARTPKAA
jgi:hypothetical protein